ncbi:MAG TPA: hypothetical protein VFO05_17240 [Candidatus Limnocylindrales bacterium]|nr:hypothetical protein [Candidatus Limnocylindrales bacterium]
MIATYSRTGGRGLPPEAEFLAIADDGSIDLRRTSGTPAVGRFDGRLGASERAHLGALAAAAAAAGSVDARMPPDSSLVTMSAGDAAARYGDGAPPAGPWAELGQALAGLLDTGLDEPIAAIELVIADGGRSARLVHRGTEAVAVDLSGLAVRAVLWQGYYELVGEWAAPVAPGADARTTASPGWSVDVPFEHGLELRPARTLHASALFGLGVDDGPIVPVLASVAPALPPGGGA